MQAAAFSDDDPIINSHTTRACRPALYGDNLPTVGCGLSVITGFIPHNELTK